MRAVKPQPCPKDFFPAFSSHRAGQHTSFSLTSSPEGCDCHIPGVSPEEIATAFSKPRGAEGSTVPGSGWDLLIKFLLQVTKLPLWDALSRAKCFEILG